MTMLDKKIVGTVVLGTFVSVVSADEVLVTGAKVATPNISIKTEALTAAPVEIKGQAGSVTNLGLFIDNAELTIEGFDSLDAFLESTPAPLASQKNHTTSRTRLDTHGEKARGSSAAGSANAQKGEFKLTEKQKGLLIDANNQLWSNYQLASQQLAKKVSQLDARVTDSARLSRLRARSNAPEKVRIRYGDQGAVRSVAGSFPLTAKVASISANVESFLRENSDDLNLAQAFTYELTENCTAARCIVKAKKLFEGKEVFGDDLSVIATGGNIIRIAGHMAPWPATLGTKSINAKIDPEYIARQHLNLVNESLPFPVKLVGGYRFAKGRYHEVVKVTLVHSPTVAWDVFVSLSSGEVVDQLSVSYDQTSVLSSGDDLLGVNHTFYTQSDSPSAFRMVDDSFPRTAGANTLIADVRNAEALDPAYYVTSNSADGPWDASAVSALINSRKSYDYFKDTFGRDGIDGNDGNMVAFIHYGSNYVNAFYMNVEGGVMAYGDGDGVVSNSLARALDVAGHELTHGVVARTAGLEYRFQSGALNESFADFFGAQIDGDDWLMGEDTWLIGPDCGGGQKCLRNLADPTRSYAQQPAHMDDFQNLSIEQDKGGVHVNSGIPNKAMYLIAEGLPESLGRPITAQLAYGTLLSLTPTSDFQDAAETMLAVAQLDGFPAGAADVVAAAWEQVGISLDAPEPPPVVVTEPTAASNSALAYLYYDSESGGYTPYIQGIDENNYGYLASLDADATVVYPPEQDPTIFIPNYGALQRLSLSPVNGGTENTPYKGFFYAYVGDSDAPGSQLYLNFLFNIIENGEQTFWGVSDNPPPPIDLPDIQVQNISLSPNYVNDRTFVMTLRDSPYIYTVTPEGITPVTITGPDFTQEGSASALVNVVDSLRWDPSSRKVVFDYLSCVPLPDGTCTNFWSVGVLDTASSIVSYPFASQPSNIDLGYPAYSNLTDRVFVMDLHQYDEDTGAYLDQFALVFDTYTGTLYGTGVSANDCEADYGVWSSPSFSSDDYDFLHQKCIGTQSQYSYVNYATSYDYDLEDWVETSLNDYSSELPVASPSDEYHIASRLEFSAKDEEGAGTYTLSSAVEYGTAVALTSSQYCWKNPINVASSVLEAYRYDGVLSNFTPEILLPGQAQCSDVVIAPPPWLFENEPGFVYVANSVRANTELAGGLRYQVAAARPPAPVLSQVDPAVDKVRLEFNAISSGGARDATWYLDCGEWQTSQTWAWFTDFAQSSAAFYDLTGVVRFGLNNVAPATTLQCSSWVTNYVGQGDVFEFTLSTLDIDTDGDGVGDSTDAFPDDPDEAYDTDGDGIGDNTDDDDDGDGFSDAQELAEGSDPLDAASTPDGGRGLNPIIIKALMERNTQP